MNRWAEGVAALALALLLTVALAWRADVFRGDFGTEPDESSHLLNALLIRDYLLSGFGANPLEYAEAYYAHYPKIALGMWGVGHPLALAVWTLVVSDARWSVLLFVMVVNTLAAWFAFLLAREALPRWAAWCVAVLVVVSPVTAVTRRAVLADDLLALWAVAALWIFCRDEERPGARRVVWFVALLAAGALTKVNGLALLALPVVWSVLRWNWSLWRRRAFRWSAAAALVVIVPVQAVPVLLVTSGGTVPAWSLATVGVNTRRLGELAAMQLGWVLLMFVVVGLWYKLGAVWRSRRVEAVWAGAGALLVVTAVLHAVQPHPLWGRHIAMATVPLMLFAAAGMTELARRLPGALPAPSRAAVVVLLVAVMFRVEASRVYVKGHWGLQEAAAAVFAEPAWRESRMLVVGEAAVEGGFIAEVALRDRRPGRVVLRGSKVLSSSAWDGKQFRLLFDTPEAAMARLEELAAGVVVLVRGESADEGLMRAVIAAFPERWRHAGGFGPAVEMYELIGHQALEKRPLEIELKYTLGRTLRLPGQ